MGKAGRPPTNPKGREWFRHLVDEEDLRRKYEANLRAKLDAGDTDAFLKTFEHGYGRPAQALDVKTTVDMPSGALTFILQPAGAVAIGETDG